jgi:hypothetical protein
MRHRHRKHYATMTRTERGALCGEPLGSAWYEMSTTDQGKVTCGRCQRSLVRLARALKGRD